MHHPTDRIAHTAAFVTPVVDHWLEREIAQWVLPTKDRSDEPSHHERTLLPRSYISLPSFLKHQDQDSSVRDRGGGEGGEQVGVPHELAGTREYKQTNRGR